MIDAKNRPQTAEQQHESEVREPEPKADTLKPFVSPTVKSRGLIESITGFSF